MTLLFGVLIGVAALVTASGFIKPHWFVSVGYAFSVVAMVVATVIVDASHLTAAATVQLLLLFAWGVRLGTFLAIRERKRSYKNRPDAIKSSDLSVPMRILSWVGVTVLYVAMFSPAAYVPGGDSEPSGVWAVVRWVGLGVMAIGFAVEATADAQKQAAKRRDPSAFVPTGLFSVVRAPNYLGEILMWVGNLTAGAGLLTTGWRIGVAVVGTAMLILIMLGATRRLEWSQGRRYGSQPAYQTYIRTVPILFPLVPIYSVEKTKIPMV